MRITRRKQIEKWKRMKAKTENKKESGKEQDRRKTPKRNEDSIRTSFKVRLPWLRPSSLPFALFTKICNKSENRELERSAADDELMPSSSGRTRDRNRRNHFQKNIFELDALHCEYDY